MSLESDGVHMRVPGGILDVEVRVQEGRWGGGEGPGEQVGSLGRGWGSQSWGRAVGAAFSEAGLGGTGQGCAHQPYSALSGVPPPAAVVSPQQTAELGTGSDPPHLLHHGEGLELLPLHHHR